ncbi:MAG: DNA-directed RNA polymerase subunit alpha [Actinobacteria bacterium]|nr:DNA-directed RNA polymerase subunit alpha [Actinomycetota bacterium]
MLIAQRPTLSEEVISENRSRFIIEPLEPGFGYTLGNSMRRTLLSSIPGAAVTSIRVAGALHEFTTLEGVKEDLTDIVLNIKNLVFSSDSDDPAVVYIRKSGAGPVTGADIAVPSGVDSIYSPVLKVTYKVEATRVEQRTDFDRLVVDVETKASMKPRDAVASAGRTLVELFGLARELNLEAEGIEMGPSVMDAALAADLALPIEDLDLTVRSYNCLKREGIHTVGELVARSEADLLDIRNFGSKSIDEVKAKLVSMGMSLKDSPAGFDPTKHQNYNAAVDDDFVDADQA